MSPASFKRSTTELVQAGLDRAWAAIGESVRDARLSRRWTTEKLAEEAGVSRWIVYLAERGEPTSLESCVRLAVAMRLRLEVDLVDPHRKSTATKRDEDPVHAAIGELEAKHPRALGYTVGVDEPYQHYQFAGRTDVLATSTERRALLHIENRTRFPNVQEAAGAYNAKRAYLAPIVAERIGLRRGFRSVTHAMVCLWSAEVLHSLRLRPETFRSLCPDPTDAFTAWWSDGSPPNGTFSTLLLVDPFAMGRQRVFLDLESALDGARPRVQGYAEAVQRLRSR